MHRSILALSLLSALAGPARAQRYTFEADPSSAAQLTLAVTGDLPGAIIGDHDPVANPGGTQTRLGLFGGSGNQTVPFDISAVAGLDETSSPDGSFGLDLDLGALTFELDGLAFDPLDGGTASVDLTLTVLFDTFRSFAPDSVYFGGIPLPLPITGVSVSELTFAQTAAAPGVVAPRGAAGMYDLTVAVPAELSVSVDFNGSVTAIDPVATVLPLSGVLDLTGPAPQITFRLMQSTQQVVDDPLGGMPLADIPIPLPTILPPGSVANVLYTGTLDSIDLSLDIDAVLVANGTPECAAEVFCSSNPNSTGVNGSIAMTGTTSLAANDFGLVSSDLPAGRSGIFFYGTQSASQPFGDGVRCVGGSVVRNTLQTTTAMGQAARSLDLVTPANPNGVVQPGETRYFQFWHRDGMAGAGFTTSDGLEVTFCP